MEGIYIHVPFCRGKCPYCDFYSVSADRDYIHRYALSVVDALKSCPYSLCADTLYFGGGTPTLMSTEDIGDIIGAASRFAPKGFKEITCEANPNTISKAMLHGLIDAGVDRLSIGVQSTSDRILGLLGRRHSAQMAIESIKLAKEAGIKRVSADLMLGVETQSIDELLLDIENLVSAGVDHISAYILKLEPNTPFYLTASLPDDDFISDMWLSMCRAMKKHGFVHYEISNFASSMDECSLHNLHYWRCDGYLGVGPAAHSFLNGVRFYFPRDVDTFINTPYVWQLGQIEGDGGDEEERIMLALRLVEGIELKSLSCDTQKRVISRAQKLIAQGLADIRSGRLSLTEKGMLVSNSVITYLLS